MTTRKIAIVFAIIFLLFISVLAAIKLASSRGAKPDAQSSQSTNNSTDQGSRLPLTIFIDTPSSQQNARPGLKSFLTEQDNSTSSSIQDYSKNFNSSQNQGGISTSRYFRSINRGHIKSSNLFNKYKKGRLTSKSLKLF